jgi:hypothetical protein
MSKQTAMPRLPHFPSDWNVRILENMEGAHIRLCVDLAVSVVLTDDSEGNAVWVVESIGNTQLSWQPGATVIPNNQDSVPALVAAVACRLPTSYRPRDTEFYAWMTENGITGDDRKSLIGKYRNAKTYGDEAGLIRFASTIRDVISK